MALSEQRFLICFLSAAHEARDKRVFEKEAVSLAQAGFAVVHLAPGDGERVQERGVEIVTYSRGKGLWGRLMQLPRLYRLAARIDADCYHCNEVDSWLVGVLLKLARRKKVVFDVHEHYPDNFAESRFPRWLQPLAAGVVRLLFRLLSPFTDRMVLAKQSVAVDFHGAERKQVLVQNFAPLVERRDRPVAETGREKGSCGGTITAIHLGLISRLRGWPRLLDALAQAESEKLHLKIVGTFNDGSEDAFRQRVSQCGLEGRVCIEEWMPFEQMYQRILSSHIGLVLFQPGIQNHVHALPHKMFDYMLAGLPVVAPAFAVEVASIIKEADCGVLVDPSDASEIAQAFDYLVSDAQERQRLGENGRRAVVEKYNWEGEVRKLVAMYRGLAAEAQ